MWKHISTAKNDCDLQLAVIDKDGTHALVFPCRHSLGGWIVSNSKQRIYVNPTHWRDWDEAQEDSEDAARNPPMGNNTNPSLKLDLFSTAQQLSDTSPLSASEPVRKDEPAATASPSYALPTNLPSALKHLDDNQLDRLLSAVLAELKQRGKKLSVSDETSRKQQIKEVAPPLAEGKLNAVRAAFKAGVRPSRIARQFGISQSDVKKVLASDRSK